MKRALIGLLAWAVISTAADAQTVGTCSPALADAYIDIGNVRARILNNGNLFYRDEELGYNLPKGSKSHAVFAAGLWIGGMVAGSLRMAAARYSGFEFWPGPLDESGNPPADCSRYDRIFVVSKADVAAYEASGTGTPDLLDWPTGLGAPTLDATGDEMDLSALNLSARADRRIDLAAGERPAFLGDQMAWWVMNDLGNAHLDSKGAPVGVEVHGLAFAFDAPGHVGNATFYRYTIQYRGTDPLEEAHIALFMDPDLGDYYDDWIGSDSLLGLGYAWNSDNADDPRPSEPDRSYGSPPPAIGIDFFQGPVVESPGDTARVRNRQLPGFRNLPMTAFMEPERFEWPPPAWAPFYYEMMRARWYDGVPLTEGGHGRDFTSTPTRFQFSGDASRCAYWTECNWDGTGGKRSPGDRRFVASTGPVDMAPGSRQEILFGIVYARGEDNFDSVTALKKADAALQRFVDSWFAEWPAVEPAYAPPAPPELLTPADFVTGQPLRPHLAWDCPLEAIYCEVQLDNDERFEAPERVSFGGTFDPDLASDQTYFWRARAWGRSDVAGEWSPTRRFRTGSTRFQPVIADFQVVSNAAGLLDPPECGAFGFNGSGFPLAACGSDRPDAARQQAAAAVTWGIHARGAAIPFGPISDRGSFLGVALGDLDGLEVVAMSDFEIRFTDRGGKALRQDGTFMDVPFEAWSTGKGTPDDPSDDVRLLPRVIDTNVVGVFDIGGDHALSGGANDPATDAITLHLPDTDGDGSDDRAPGEGGYDAWLSGTGSMGRAAWHNLVFVCFNCGAAPPYPQAHPEIGTVFRILTSPKQAPILAAPASGPVIRGSELRFFWTAAEGFPVTLQVSTSPGFETFVARFPEAEPGVTLRLAEPGEYYWRVGSDLTGWSETWVANVVSLTGTDNAAELPTEFALDSIWPNPFNPLATIRFGLPADAVATVDVVDVLGRRVAVIDAGARRAAGWHTVQFDGSRLASGVYFVRLTAGGKLDVKSVVLLK